MKIHYLTRFLTVTDLILYLGKSFPDSVQFLFFVLFSKYSLEYAIFYMQAVLTDTGCAHGKDFTCYLSRQRPSGIELYNILKTFDFKINPRSWCNFFILILSTWVGLPHCFICTRQAVQNRSSACSPCTSNCTHHTDIQAAPLAARRHSNFLDLHASVSTLSTSSTPVCVSAPLQLYSFSRSLHPSAAPVPNHSHPACTRAVWSVPLLVVA